jgi:hypothetical protein
MISFSYRIVHCGKISNDGKKLGCDNDHSNYPCSAEIDDFLGENGLVNLLSMIDPGE